MDREENQRKPPPSVAGRTLVIQLADLGDLLLAAPAVSWLRQRTDDDTWLLTKRTNAPIAEALVGGKTIYADKHLFDRWTIIVRPAALVEALGLVWRIRKLKFTRVVVLHHFTTRFGAIKFALLSLLSGARERIGLDNGRGWFLTQTKPDHGFGAGTETDYWVHLVGGEASIALPRDDAGAEDLIRAQGVGRPFAVLHPGSGTFALSRRWEPASYRDLALLIHEQFGYDIVLVGGSEEERSLAESIAGGRPWAFNLAGTTTLPMLVSLLEQAALYIGNDGGVSQIASRLTIPSVIIFGPTSEMTWHVDSPWSVTASVDLPCRPGLYHHRELGDRSGCATNDCLTLLTPDDVLASAVQLLATLKKRDPADDSTSPPAGDTA